MAEATLQHLTTLAQDAAAAALAQPPSQWCQAFFLGASAGITALHALPASLRGLVTDYGPRGIATNPQQQQQQQQQQRSSSWTGRLIGTATRAGQVPHAWFWHFYVLSVAASAFWAWQFLGKGRVLRALVEWQSSAAPVATTMTAARDDAETVNQALGRLFAAWLMMALQGTRRLYESLLVMRTGSGSTMWFVHWVMGLAFYAVMSISVWIEDSDAILASWEAPDPSRLLSSRVPAAMAIYFWAWIRQNECHAHLASLKKYTLPTAGLFRFLVCPHYTCECLIYLTIAYTAAPTGHWFSGPVICGLAFVATNLGTTAIGTRRWNAEKFGVEAVASRWTMIPLVF